MPEEGHECLEGHAAVGEFGGPGVAQLVSDDPQRLPVAVDETGCFHGVA